MPLQLLPLQNHVFNAYNKWTEMRKKEEATKPLAAGEASPRVKWGRARPRNPSGHRRPPTDCWPTQATIWAMLMGEPLLPHWDMIRGALVGGRPAMHRRETPSRPPLRRPVRAVSRDSRASQPGWRGKGPSPARAMRVAAAAPSPSPPA